MFERFRRRREAKRAIEDERLERQQARMAAYREREQTSSIASVATALGAALDRTFQIESRLLEQMGGFLAVLEEASAKKAAQVLGARGGKRTQERRKRLPPPPECPLCRDPMYRAVTTEMISAHRAHAAQQQQDGVAQ